MTSTDKPADNHRPAVASIVDVISRYVTDLTFIGPDELSAWLPGLPVPSGWHVGRAANSPVQPTRTTVHRRDPLAGWDACETVNVFRFKRIPPPDVIRFNVASILRAGGAQDVTVHAMQTPAKATMSAARSTGYLTLANQQSIWAQYTPTSLAITHEDCLLSTASSQCQTANPACATTSQNSATPSNTLLPVPSLQDQNRTSTHPVVCAKAIFHYRKRPEWPPSGSNLSKTSAFQQSW